LQHSDAFDFELDHIAVLEIVWFRGRSSFRPFPIDASLGPRKGHPREPVALDRRDDRIRGMVHSARLPPP
jgi:hypothetical protein